MADKKESSKKKITKFFKEVRYELKKVIWPSKEQLINNTATVLFTCFIIGVIIWVTDYFLKLLFQLVYGA